jgi:hypothetical protein
LVVVDVVVDSFVAGVVGPVPVRILVAVGVLVMADVGAGYWWR